MLARPRTDRTDCPACMGRGHITMSDGTAGHCRDCDGEGELAVCEECGAEHAIGTRCPGTCGYCARHECGGDEFGDGCTYVAPARNDAEEPSWVGEPEDDEILF